MAVTIENYIRLTVRDCKRLGFFSPDAYTSGHITWTQGADVVASVGFATNLRGTTPYAVLNYNYKGEPVHTEITLRFKPSNLKAGTGYYYFVCPATGLSCRNLYLVGGRFVSRTAFRPLYSTQAETKIGKKVSFGFLRSLWEYEDMEAARYRRKTYRGKLTPWGRKLEKYAARAGVLYGRAEHRAKTKGWESL